MKLAELNPRKEYFIYNREHWIDAGYSRDSYYSVAQALRHNRYRIVTDTLGNIRRNGSTVLVIGHNSTRTEWVTLKSIRAEFFEAVALITNHNRNKRNRWNDRGIRYALHMQRKADHARQESEKPIKDNFMKAIKTLAPYAWEETKLNHLPIEAMLAITIAINSQPNQIRKAS